MKLCKWYRMRIWWMRYWNCEQKPETTKMCWIKMMWKNAHDEPIADGLCHQINTEATFKQQNISPIFF